VRRSFLSGLFYTGLAADYPFLARREFFFFISLQHIPHYAAWGTCIGTFFFACAREVSDVIQLGFYHTPDLSPGCPSSTITRLGIILAIFFCRFSSLGRYKLALGLSRTIWRCCRLLRLFRQRKRRRRKSTLLARTFDRSDCHCSLVVIKSSMTRHLATFAYSLKK